MISEKCRFFSLYCSQPVYVHCCRHAGILMGISNTVGTIPGMLAPTVAGLLTPNVSYSLAYLDIYNTVQHSMTRTPYLALIPNAP